MEREAIHPIDAGVLLHVRAHGGSAAFGESHDVEGRKVGSKGKGQVTPNNCMVVSTSTLCCVGTMRHRG